MLRSYTLLNKKDDVIQTNRCHLIKMDSNFVKIESDNDIHNDRSQTKNKTARQQLNLEKWTNLERMPLKFKKHRASQLEKDHLVALSCLCSPPQ